MRILVVSNLYPPVVFGGYEILCQQVVEALRRRGHVLDVLASSFGREGTAAEPTVERSLALTTPFPRPGEDVGRVDFSLRTRHRVALRNRRLALAALRRTRAELLFCWGLNRIGIGPLHAAQSLGVPAVYTVNDEHPRQFAFQRRPRGARPLAKALAETLVWPLATLRHVRRFPVIVISEALKARLLGHGLPFEHAEVIHQGVQLSRLAFQPAARAPGEPLRVLYAGQLSEAKGVHTVIRALGRLPEAERGALTLDIAGSGVPSYVAQLEALARDAGVGERVQFLGQVPHEQIADLYHAHHVLVFSSEWEEPFGLTHLEAMAAGCAVISTTTGGSRELIRHGDNALAYAAGDPAALAERLAALARDEDQRRALVDRARADVEARFSFDGYLDRVEALLARCVAAPTRAGRQAS